MPFEFRLPDIGEGVAEGEVVQWFVQEGQTIHEDAPLVSVLTDKANVEIPSPKSGRIVKLHAAVGEKVKVGGLLVTIETGAPGAAVPPSPAPSSSAAPPPSAAPGGRPLPPPPPPTGTPPSEGGSPGGASGAGSTRVQAAPSVRRLAAERGIDLTTVRGSGPGGRIVEADLAGPTGPPVPPAPPPGAASPSSPGPTAPAGGAEPVERIPLRGVRRVIAEHMTESRHRAAHYTYVEEIDASELVRIRDRMAKHVERDGVKLSYLPFVVKAVVAGLRAYPQVNARMDDERQELVVYKQYHLGIATAAPEGLIVPIIRDAERKSVSRLAREIQELAEKARAGKLQRSEITGGTFTITSLGALGGVLATPILNYPEVAILGVHKITRRPVYRADGSIGPADLMNLSISLDHRVLDGIIGAQFLRVVKECLEDPHQLFAELA